MDAGLRKEISGSAAEGSVYVCVRAGMREIGFEQGGREGEGVSLIGRRERLCEGGLSNRFSWGYYAIRAPEIGSMAGQPFDGRKSPLAGRPVGIPSAGGTPSRGGINKRDAGAGRGN